mgnify:CR=1 FL=1
MAQNTALQTLIEQLRDRQSISTLIGAAVIEIVIREATELLPKERQDGIQLVFNGMKFMAEDLGEQESNYGIAEKIFTQTFTQNK